MKNGFKKIRLDLITSIGERKKAEKKAERYAAIIKALRNCQNCFNGKYCSDIVCHDSGIFKNWCMGVKVDG